MAGYLFISLFCIMTSFMIARNKKGPHELSLRSMLHILIAMVLTPLLLVKVLIARYYKIFTTALVPLGVTIFTLGFVLIALTAGPFLLRRAAVKDVSLQTIQMGAARIDLEGAEATPRGNLRGREQEHRAHRPQPGTGIEWVIEI